MNASPEARPLATVNQVAAYLSVTPRTVRNLIARGEIGTLKVGRLVRIRWSAVDAYLDASSAPKAQPEPDRPPRPRPQPGPSGADWDF
jgi:excisionase family DNA binding protein